MGFFSKEENKNELVLLFDIGSSSVGGALFYIEETGNPTMLYSARENIILENNLNVESFFALTISSLEKLVEKIAKQGLGKPERIFCVLSSPWFHSQTRNIKFEQETPFVFNTKLADNLIQKEVENLLNTFSKDKNEQNKVLPIEMKTMSVKLNGYEISDFFNKKAKDLEMPIFVSMSEEVFIKAVENTINKFFHFLMASFTVARDMFINQDKFLLVNIGGEITDISMIKSNVVRDNTSFPMGSNFMVRGLIKDLKIDNNEARSILSLYKDNHASDSANKQVGPTLENLKNEWLKSFQETLNNLSHDISIPSTIFITLDQNLAQFFSEIIKTEQLNQYSLTESKFRIVFLGTEALHGIVLFQNDKVERDAFLIIEAIYINRFLK